MREPLVNNDVRGASNLVYRGWCQKAMIPVILIFILHVADIIIISELLYPIHRPDYSFACCTKAEAKNDCTRRFGEYYTKHHEYFGQSLAHKVFSVNSNGFCELELEEGIVEQCDDGGKALQCLKDQPKDISSLCSEENLTKIADDQKSFLFTLLVVKLSVLVVSTVILAPVEYYLSTVKNLTFKESRLRRWVGLIHLLLTLTSVAVSGLLIQQIRTFFFIDDAKSPILQKCGIGVDLIVSQEGRIVSVVASIILSAAKPVITTSRICYAVYSKRYLNRQIEKENSLASGTK